MKMKKNINYTDCCFLFVFWKRWFCKALPLFGVLLIAANCLAGNNWAWPTNWVVFGPIPASENISSGNAPIQDDLISGEHFKKIPEEIVVNSRKYPAQAMPFAGGKLDLGEFFGNSARGNTAYLLAKIQCASALTARLYVGADWWMQWWLNGKPVFGTIPGGNQFAPVAISNHSFNLELDSGDNVLAVAVIGGSSSWTLAAGGPRELNMAPPKTSDFQQVFDKARATKSPAAARDAYLLAAKLAGTDYEKGRALLAAGRLWLSDMQSLDAHAIRNVFEDVLNLKGVLPAQRAEAQQGIAETCLLEQNYAAAFNACAAAWSAADDPISRARTQRILAMGFLQKRDYARAHAELTSLLAMEGLDKLDAGGAAQTRPEIEALRDVLRFLPLMRSDHPRLFFNAETWPAVRERALTVEKMLLEKFSAMIDNLPLENIQGNLDRQIMESAFVYRVTGNRQTFAKVQRMLRKTVDALPGLDKLGGIQAVAVPRISWAAALDWVWNDLPPPERLELARAMTRYAWGSYCNAKQTGKLAAWPHYYTRSSFFYIGLAVLNEDLGDVEYFRALSVLAIGLKQHRDRFAFLLRDAGKTGVWQTNVEYDFSTVPGPVFTFLHAWSPATGMQLPPEWVHLGINPEFILRMVPGFENDQFLHLNYAGHSGGAWGFGRNRSSHLYDWLAQHMHFFAKSHPQSAAMAHELRQRMDSAGVSEDTDYPLLRFFLTDFEQAPAPSVPDNLPIARYCPGNGLVVMSSGFSSNDTYALFSAGAGGGSPSRRHDFDAAHFSIYYKGYLAVDSGVRNAFEHSANYRHQTVAHNAVLIRMDGEKFNSVSGAVISNSGGQNQPPHVASNLAFSASALYAYAALDVTPVYNPEKCENMTRQFLFLPPSYFIVFDRVRARQAVYPKTWLLHTANEPDIEGHEFHADQGSGRIFCRTLLPQDAIIEKIGGPGREFWADGRNWPIVDAYRDPNKKARTQASSSGDWWKRYGRGHAEPIEVMGRWRVEVKPGAARNEDCFLHLIQVSDRTADKMIANQVQDGYDKVTLSFEVGMRAYSVMFNKTGAVGGHIRITESGKVEVDEPLANAIVFNPDWR